MLVDDSKQCTSEILGNEGLKSLANIDVVGIDCTSQEDGKVYRLRFQRFTSSDCAVDIDSTTEEKKKSVRIKDLFRSYRLRNKR